MAKSWKQEGITMEELNAQSEHTMGVMLGIKFIGIGDNYLKASMPINDNSRQPYGLLHGGASAA